eukprot:gnl/Dysnectes_brevis/5325_a7609_489.p1 GENE.gnl/Dysnectes_brevis/5325_a7609_489~~gnl/Dysnectes_brevis/5325_a7609_489.p1  ORF type:complete len:221 (+),score=28.55 gnl/Dysnectes_brevis/5325_a7609_489:156-818(+)
MIPTLSPFVQNPMAMAGYAMPYPQYPPSMQMSPYQSPFMHHMAPQPSPYKPLQVLSSTGVIVYTSLSKTEQPQLRHVRIGHDQCLHLYRLVALGTDSLSASLPMRLLASISEVTAEADLSVLTVVTVTNQAITFFSKSLADITMLHQALILVRPDAVHVEKGSDSVQSCPETSGVSSKDLQQLVETKRQLAVELWRLVEAQRERIKELEGLLGAQGEAET